MAIAEYEKALQAQPGEAGIHYNLGLAYIQKGMLKEAAAEFQTALTMNPNCAEARAALAKIHRGGGIVPLAKP